MKFLIAFCAVLFSTGIAHAQCVGQGGIPFNCAAGSVPGATDLFLGGNKVGPHANATVNYTGLQVAQGVFSLIPSLSGGGSVNFLGSDGTWKNPLAGLGSMATQNAGAVAITGGTLTTPTITGGTISGADASGTVVKATGTTGARTAAERSADFVNVKDGRNGQPGAKGDGRIASPVITLSGTSLTTGAATFAAADAGKVIVIANAGTAPTTGPVETDAVTASGAGYTSVPSCAVTDASSSGSGATCVALMSLQSATVVGTGLGCLTGAFEMVLGTDGLQATATAAGVPTGTPAKITGTVASGSITGTVTITNGGVLTALGNLSTAPAYGANCTTAPTFALSYGVAAVQITALGTAYSTTQTTVALTGGSPTTAATLAAPLIGAPTPPLVTTIASYISPTSITLTASAPTSISGAATQLMWATNDYQAFQNAISGNLGIWVPAGIYWIGGTLDPGTALTVRGEGMQNTILAFDNGTSVVQDTGNWTPLFENLTGSSVSLKGDLQFEDFQVRGLLDFGRVNVGAAVTELNNYTGLMFNRVKFYQIPWFGMENEVAKRFEVTNSIFDTVMRDQARCRSCFSARIIGNKFIHSDDDSVALHQANYIQGPGVIREGIVVEGNDFEDTNGVDIVGARDVVVRGNSFRRTKIYAISISYSASEGINQMRSVDISDNTISDVMGRYPSIGTYAINVSQNPPNAPTGVTSFLPGAASFPSLYFGKPWDYDLNSVVVGAAFAPPMRGLSIHDNHIMRTLPATSSYSSWGYGPVLTNAGFISPPMTDVMMTATAGISTNVNLPGQDIHHNDIQDVRRGIVINNGSSGASQMSLSVNFNHIYNTWEYGFIGFGTGTIGSFDFIGNVVDVDPYNISPGRAGSHGSWVNAYAASRCFSSTYSGVVNMSLNTYSDCYSIQTSSSWVISNNIIRGAPFNGLTGQLTSWTNSNFGIGVYPNNTGNQFYIANVNSDPSAVVPTSYGTFISTRVTQAAAAPTTGYHVIGDVIASTAPGTCTCSGWLALTTGTAWTSGTDYKVMPIQ